MHRILVGYHSMFRVQYLQFQLLQYKTNTEIDRNIEHSSVSQYFCLFCVYNNYAFWFLPTQIDKYLVLERF